MTVEDVQTGKSVLTAESGRRTETMWEQNAEDTPVYTVVSAVADATGEDPCELPPLAREIDPDALNALFTSNSVTEETTVQFQYSGYTVAVRGNGEVELHASG
ncbi:HalOD1 output domain-containing protein [Natronobacterium texcoconense]|uniref:Halobacterial output domain-containing protein n=1 Tax=Natronobacterium texcoconense TaxID=1095778 RepID=A0A1H1BGW0_NATTX|nr:HalOD1 output domain-containing protein [Natronobacterium texcoconense]SDQ51121.1 hypothetical protein SAMN04489842_1038 [Natronobacterium texcoconense]